MSDSTVCNNATTLVNNKKIWNKNKEDYVFEAEYRKLDCGIERKGNQLSIYEKIKLMKTFSGFRNKKICDLLQKKLINH